MTKLLSRTLITLTLPLLAACAAASPANTLVVYSGRSEALVGPLIEQFEAETGIDVQVRYGDTAELAATILEEGERSPADLYYAQDAGALGAIAEAGLAAPLPDDLLDMVEPRFRSADGLWIGTSGRARVVVYNPTLVSPEDLPDSISGFTAPEWKGRIGWSPTNGSFQSFVTAMRVNQGEAATRDWLEGIQANEPSVYPGNSQIVEAVANGEVAVGFVNHYYLYRFLAEDPGYPAQNYFLPGGDIGAMINVAGVAVLENAANRENALRFAEFLISKEAEEFYRDETFEYPLAAGVEPYAGLPPLESIITPDMDLSDLSDLEGTLTLLIELRILE